jgi:hypothetical protein
LPFGASRTTRKRKADKAGLLALVYIAGALMLSQRIVVRASGMKYSEFLGEVRATFSSDT